MTCKPWAILAYSTASAPAPALIRVATAISHSSLDRIQRCSQISPRTEVVDVSESGRGVLDGASRTGLLRPWL